MGIEKKAKCFIITPIGDDSDPIRRHIEGVIDAAITPSLSDKYDIVVAHKISEPGSITKQVISEIYNSKLVIANLTNRNPNVMYELALRQAIGKPAIMIAEKGTPLPADIITQRTIFYYNDAKGVLELREELIKAEKEIDYEIKSGPIYDVLGDISNDTKLIENAEQTHNDDIQPLEYILKRLNRIEDAIRTSRTRPPMGLIEQVLPKKIAMVFKYKKVASSMDRKQLESRISQVKVIDTEAMVEDVIIDTETKIIIIYLIITGLIDMAGINKYIIEVLSDSGFENITSMDPKSGI